MSNPSRAERKQAAAKAAAVPVSPVANIARLDTPDYFTREAFNNLRTNLRFSGADIKTVMITSCMPNEGKSTTAFELARSLVEDGKHVLLVDLDLRKSIFVGKYGVTTNGELKGMAHYLSGQAREQEILYRTNVEGLDVIFPGHSVPNPTELLGGELFASLMQSVRGKYDMIILDTPPLGTVVDAALAAPHCDGAILLVQSHSVSWRFAMGVKRQLEATGVKLLGVVLNKADSAQSGYYHYGYYKGYYKKHYSYYGDGKSAKEKK